MSKFLTAQYLASWAGTTPGNPYLQGALGTAVISISHTRDTDLAAKYRRIAVRRGPLCANVAIQRALLAQDRRAAAAAKREQSEQVEVLADVEKRNRRAGSV